MRSAKNRKNLRRHLAAMTLAAALSGCTGTGFAPEDAKAQLAARPLDVQRGQLLYETHCIACHTTQAHWRDNSVVGAWSDVLAQVDRWQKTSGQQWGPSEVGDVAAYLNAVYYKMPCPVPGCQGKATATFDQYSVVARSGSLGH